MNTIQQIDNLIKWLDSRAKSTAIVEISQTLNKLSILTVSLSEEVSKAYALMNELEDVYDGKFAEAFVKLTNGGISAAAAKVQVEAELKEDKKNFTTAKNGYRKLNSYLERLDKVLESFRQSISVQKMDLKHLPS